MNECAQKRSLKRPYKLNSNEWSVRTHGRKIPLKSSLPFIKSKRGALTHRVKCGQIHKILHKHSHSSMDAYCGMTLFPHKSELTDKPSSNEIVCKHCEAKAIIDGQPSSFELVGRHVHIGCTKAVAECCDVTIEQPLPDGSSDSD